MNARKKISKPPVVRQTKASMFRILQANPLLYLEPDKYKNIDIPFEKMQLPKKLSKFCNLLGDTLSQTTRESNFNITRHEQDESNIFKKKSNNNLPQLQVNGRAVTERKEKHFKPILKGNTTNKKSWQNNSNTCNLFSKPLFLPKNGPCTPTRRNTWTSPKPITLRKSFSADDISDIENNSRSLVKEMNTSQSLKNIYEVESDGVSNLPIFKTPIAYNRRSIKLVTPGSIHGIMLPKYVSTPSNTFLDELVNSSKVSSYQMSSLRLFDGENKENTSNNPQDSLSLKEESFCCKKALEDLYKLILDGYSLEKCDIWLNKIKEKEINITEDPLFWECKAAIEAQKDKFDQSLEHRSIKQEVEDESVKYLLNKFKSMGIRSPNPEHSVSRRKSIHPQTPGQLVQSKSIKFALEEKKSNKSLCEGDTEFLVRPVRRSTRRRSSYAVTPGVTLCSSMSEIDSSITSKMSFKSNKLLL